MTRTARAPRLSLCVIARDEASTIGRCLESARRVADDVVVVDTGSRDDTGAVAASHGARVIQHRWADDFAAARNAALAAARGTWVLSMDADEVLPAATAARLHATLEQATSPALRLAIESVGATGALDLVQIDVRLFLRDPRHRWTGAVYEQVTAAVTADAALPIVHHGWADPASRRRKLARNHALLQPLVAQAPDDPRLLAHLARAQLEMGRAENAVATAERALGLDRARGHLGLELLDLLALARTAAGRPEAAADVCRIVLALRPDWIDPRLLLGQLCRRAGRAREAALHFERWLCDRASLAEDPTWPTRLPRLRTLGAEPGVRAELALTVAALGELTRGRREAVPGPEPLEARPFRLAPAGHAGLP